MHDNLRTASGTTRNTPDEFNIFSIIPMIWSRRLHIIIGVAVGLAVAVAYLWNASYTYTAQFKVVPSESDGRKMSGLTALASLAGSSGASQTASPFTLYLVGLTGRDVAVALSADDTLMHTVFAGQWDPVAKRWRKPQSAIASLRAFAGSLLGVPQRDWAPPGPAQLQGFISANLDISEDKKTAIADIKFDHRNPQFAIHFLQRLHQANDQIIRNRMLHRTSAYIRYLQQQLGRVTLAEHRMALAQILSEQEKLRMMASANVPYAAEPFGEITASAAPTSPNVLLVVIICCGIGGLIGAIGPSLLQIARGGRGDAA